MAETDPVNKRRDIRIVGYDKRLLIAQMLLLAAVLCLPAMALSHGWAAALLCVMFFGLILAVFVQVWKLRATGLCVTVEDAESEAVETGEEASAEERSAEPQVEEIPQPSAEPAGAEPHWSDLAYPDPDVELGLIEESSAQADVHWSQTSYPDPDE
jgi:hypothetical protein